MLDKSTPENISYTEKLEKLREGFIDNSDLQSTYICLMNIPSVVTAERVREYVSKFGTVVECHPSKFSCMKPRSKNLGGMMPSYANVQR